MQCFKSKRGENTKEVEKYINLDQLQIFFSPVEAKWLANGEYLYTNHVNSAHRTADYTAKL